MVAEVRYIASRTIVDALLCLLETRCVKRSRLAVDWRQRCGRRADRSRIVIELGLGAHFQVRLQLRRALRSCGATARC